MILKTEAIVLRTIPYGDNALITNVYTRSFGLKSFIVRISRKSKTGNRMALFQPLQQIEIVFYQKAGRDIQYLTEARAIKYYQFLDQDPVCISLACYLLEVVKCCLKEEEENIELFEFIQDILSQLDDPNPGKIHTLIWFLLQFTSYLGFMPDVSAGPQSTQIYFDIESGRVEENPYICDRPGFLIFQFMQSGLQSCRQISLSRQDKTDLLNRMMLYYQYHIDGFKVPVSSQVLEEVFR